MKKTNGKAKAEKCKSLRKKLLQDKGKDFLKSIKLPFIISGDKIKFNSLLLEAKGDLNDAEMALRDAKAAEHLEPSELVKQRRNVVKAEKMIAEIKDEYYIMFGKELKDR